MLFPPLTVVAFTLSINENPIYSKSLDYSLTGNPVYFIIGAGLETIPYPSLILSSSVGTSEDLSRASTQSEADSGTTASTSAPAVSQTLAVWSPHPTSTTHPDPHGPRVVVSFEGFKCGWEREDHSIYSLMSHIDQRQVTSGLDAS